MATECLCCGAKDADSNHLHTVSSARAQVTSTRHRPLVHALPRAFENTVSVVQHGRDKNRTENSEQISPYPPTTT